MVDLMTLNCFCIFSKCYILFDFVFFLCPFERLLMAIIPLYNLACFIGPLYCSPVHNDDDDDRAGLRGTDQVEELPIVPTFLPTSDQLLPAAHLVGANSTNTFEAGRTPDDG